MAPDAPPTRGPAPDQPATRGSRAGWMVLRRVMKVPEDPPQLPPGRHEWTRSFRPSDSWMRYLVGKHLVGWAAAALFGLVFVGFIASAFVGDGGSPVVAAVIIGAIVSIAVILFAFGLMAIPIRFDTTWYVMTDRALRLRSGVWTIRETTVTFENVQNVRVRRGPIQRLLGIGDVTVETAAVGYSDPNQGITQASSAVIVGVDDPSGIRDRIVDRMRMSRSAGLGDDPDPERRRGRRAGESPGAGGSEPFGTRVSAGGGSWSPEHLQLLREIRDEVQALR